MIVDVHCHYGLWSFAMDKFEVDKVREYLDRFDVSKAIFSSAKGIVYDFAEGNRELIEFLEMDDRFLGYLVLNPNYFEESIKEVEKYKDKENEKIIGIKFHPGYSKVPIDDKRTTEIVDCFSDTNLIYLIHTWGASMASQLAKLANKFPTVKFIMGHTGGNTWFDCLEIVKPYPNIYVEPCSSYADRDKLRLSIDTVGLDRVLFGSDFTLINPAFVIGMVEGGGLTQEEKEAIYYKNAMRAFFPG